METQHLTDTELLKELENRLAQSSDTLYEQKELIRELEKVNSKLLESEKVKSHFLSNVKNEINNPLTSILGLSGLIMSGSINSIKFTETTKMIYSEAFVLNFQLQNIFIAAELEAGEAELELAATNVEDLFKRTISSFEEVYSKKNHNIKFEFSGLANITTDAAKLYIILANLLSNAIKFSAEGTQIDIVATIDSIGGTTFEVSDNGIGIAADEIPYIFDRFKQIDTGFSKEFLGQGLGLSVTKMLAELLEGKVSLQSKKGSGSEFKVFLPLLEADNRDTQLFDDEDEFLFNDEKQEF